MKHYVKASIGIALLTAMLSTGLMSCDSAKSGKTDETRDSSITSQTVTSEIIGTSLTEALTETSANELPHGGNDYFYDNYVCLLEDRFYGLPVYLYSLVGENGNEIVSEWLNKEFNFSNTEGDWKKPFSIIDFVKHFNIKKEDFIEMHKQYSPRYTEEEINALFSDKITDVYEALANPNAIYANGVIYTPQKLDLMTFEEMKNCGITEADISERIPLWSENFKNSDFVADMVKICKENNIEYEVTELTEAEPTWSAEEYAKDPKVTRCRPEDIEKYYS